MSTSTELAFLFTRDLNRLRKQIDSFASDDALWQTLPGVINPAGNLALHLEGNLREFVGRQLGKLPYSRTRDLEFSLKRLSREDVSSRLEELSQTIPSIIENLSAEWRRIADRQCSMKPGFQTGGWNRAIRILRSGSSTAAAACASENQRTSRSCCSGHSGSSPVTDNGNTSTVARRASPFRRSLRYS